MKSNLRLIVTMPALTFLCLACCSWSTWKTCMTAWEKLTDNGAALSPRPNLRPTGSNSASKSASRSSSGSLSRANGPNEDRSVQWVMTLTLACALSFWMCTLLMLVWYLLFTAYVIKESEWDHFHPVYQYRAVTFTGSSVRLFEGLGYILLLLTCSERLRLIFENSNCRLSKITVLITRGIIAGLFLSGLSAIIIYLFNERITVILSIPFLVGFLLLSGFNIVSFYSKTVAVSQGRKLSSVSPSASDLECDHQRSIPSLASASLRLTITATTATISAVISILSWIVGQSVDNHFLLWISFIIIPFSISLDSLCLLFCFRRYEPEYYFVFGRIHSLLENRL